MWRPKTSVALVGGGLLVVAGIAVLVFVLWNWINSAASPVASTTPTHASYGELYDASWRSDQATGDTVMTATMFSPTLRQLLADDTQRSQTDQQIADTISDLAPNDVPVVVTLDTVATDSTATVADEAVLKSLSLSARGMSFTPTKLVAVVPPTATDTNSSHPVSTTTRIWVAEFHPSATINWGTVSDLQLVVSGIGGVSRRVFTWATGVMLTTP